MSSVTAAGRVVVAGDGAGRTQPKVREGFVRARDEHRRAQARHTLALRPNEPAVALLEQGLREIQVRLTDPATSRTEAIALVDGLAQRLRSLPCGGSRTKAAAHPELQVPDDSVAGGGEVDGARLPTHEIAYFPEFSK